MRFDINEFRTDPSKKTQGVWVDFGGGAEFKVASFGNQEFATAFKRRLDPYTKMGREVPSDEQVNIMVYCMSRFIVLDWRGVFEGDAELPYSIENAERLLGEIEWVRDRIIEEAKRVDNFRREVAEQLEGN